MVGGGGGALSDKSPLQKKYIYQVSNLEIFDKLVLRFGCTRGGGGRCEERKGGGEEVNEGLFLSLNLLAEGEEGGVQLIPSPFFSFPPPSLFLFPCLLALGPPFLFFPCRGRFLVSAACGFHSGFFFKGWEETQKF